MEILEIRQPDPGASTAAVAFFDVRINTHIIFRNLKLTRGTSGWRVHAPNAFGAPVLSLSPTINEALVRLALSALGDEKPHDRIAA